MPQEYEPMTHQALADFLRMVADSVERHDSWEGYIEWMLPDMSPDNNGDDDVDVLARAGYRIGNNDGQGFMRFLGSIGH